jgi:hypothetical protein
LESGRRATSAIAPTGNDQGAAAKDAGEVETDEGDAAEEKVDEGVVAAEEKAEKTRAEEGTDTAAVNDAARDEEPEAVV